jgi:hypothetical protein
MKLIFMAILLIASYKPMKRYADVQEKKWEDWNSKLPVANNEFKLSGGV